LKSALAAPFRLARCHPSQLPIGIKDVLDTADMPSQYGAPIRSGWQPKAGSAPVAWARQAGGVVIGKTITAVLGSNTSPR
jgi:Asp-tRNA(Asn)/Glu-tRNA(Gln) amidotransferase A subunit family amidase